MNSINSEHIILKPIITEKALIMQSQGKYTFSVGLKANKYQIEKAFEEVFGAKPLCVNTRVLKGKLKTDWKTRKPIEKSDRKIAIISVAKDKKIELLNLNK
jgi:large subunit ribosomal protein L23